MTPRIWITWENQRRNRELSRALNAKLFELEEIDRIKNRLLKYLIGIGKVVRILRQEQPSLVFCQNPSLILATFLVTIRKFTRYHVVVDAHNAGLFPSEGRSKLLGLLSRYVQRNANLTIVTNRALKDHVEGNGGSAFILQDKIPDIPLQRGKVLGEQLNLLFICSYAEDEPYELVFEAARHLHGHAEIYVTGNYRKRKIEQSELPDNVKLLGFVPENEFVQLLNSVDATVDLTTRENCLVCGAYEAVAAQKPQILSDTRALREYFRSGAVYTAHSAEAIAEAVRMLIANKSQLEQEVRELKKLLQVEWEERRSALERSLAEILGASGSAM